MDCTADRHTATLGVDEDSSEIGVIAPGRTIHEMGPGRRSDESFRVRTVLRRAARKGTSMETPHGTAWFPRDYSAIARGSR
jgi:hypothetical protein